VFTNGAGQIPPHKHRYLVVGQFETDLLPLFTFGRPRSTCLGPDREADFPAVDLAQSS
jgi:hypothetical protein